MNVVLPAVLLVLLAGCQFAGRPGTTPAALTDCRRLSRQGVAALERGRQREALALLAKAVAVCPVDAEARRHYAEALWRCGSQTEAIAQLEEAGRLEGDDATLWARLAEMQLAVGQVDLARKNAEKSLELDPKLPAAIAVHGGVMWQTGKPQEALADYLRALGYAPKDRDVLLEIAELYRQLNQPDRALQTLQTLAETYSPGEEPGRVEYLLGMAYAALGRRDDAVESLATAASRGNATPDLFCLLGNVQLSAGRFHEAFAAAQQALALQPRHPPTLALLERIRVAQQPQETVRR
jgi:tetratricopeptide (TPR) repeat protein